jgi:hypothetical protein
MPNEEKGDSLNVSLLCDEVDSVRLLHSVQMMECIADQLGVAGDRRKLRQKEGFFESRQNSFT